MSIISIYRNYKSILNAFIRGSYYILYFRLFRKNIKIRFPFFAYEKITIHGPGSVNIGKKCSVYTNIFDGLNIITLYKNSMVYIGENCDIGGLNIRCANYIKIGNSVLTANSLLQDILFIRPDLVKCKSYKKKINRTINLGNNIWIASQSIILPGSQIDDGSVVSLGSVIYNCQFKKDNLISGSPAERGIPINRILKLPR